MKKQSSLLISAYTNFRENFDNTKLCVNFMPYDWLELPSTFNFECELDHHRLIYCQIVEEAARDLANEINHLINLVGKLEAWEVTLQQYDKNKQNNILHEFVRDIATIAITLPYTLKSRFYFSAAHLSHQANSTRALNNWADNFETLPEDDKIGQEVSCAISKNWRSWKKLNAALNKVDAGDFRKQTDNFRNKHTHRLMPRVKIGLSQIVERKKSDKGNIIYGIGGSKPIDLKNVTLALSFQCQNLSKCYQHFQALVSEQTSALFNKDEP